jgi:hypothetical protein
MCPIEQWEADGDQSGKDGSSPHRADRAESAEAVPALRDGAKGLLTSALSVLR